MGYFNPIMLPIYPMAIYITLFFNDLITKEVPSRQWGFCLLFLTRKHFTSEFKRGKCHRRPITSTNNTDELETFFYFYSLTSKTEE